MGTLYLYVFLLGLAWSIFNKYFITKLRNYPPTPWSAMTVIGYSGFLKKPLHQTLAKIATNHGPILLLRFGCRRVLLVSSATIAEDLFTKSDKVFANRPELCQGRIFGCDFTDLAWACYGDPWKKIRRVCCAEILPCHRRPDERDVLADEVKKLVRELYCNKKDSVELKPMFMDLMFNVMMRMFVGKSVFDCYCQNKTTTEEKLDHESISLLEYASRSFKITTRETDLVYFMPILKLLGFNGLERKCSDLQEKGDKIIKNIIEDVRTDSYDHGGKVIQLLLEKQKDEDPKFYSDEMIKSLILVLLSAGTDTSAGVLEWAFALLLKNPNVLRKAQNEIDDHVRNDMLEQQKAQKDIDDHVRKDSMLEQQKALNEIDDHVFKDRLLEERDIDHLPYLRCIVKETLRMYPVAPLLVPHKSSKDCKVGGYNVPKDTMLMVNVWAIHNDPEIWNEPDRFYPERFENIVDEKDGFNLMPFGFGKRSCPGKHLALRVITLALGSLIHCFDVSSMDKDIDMNEETGLALFKDKPLKVVCRPRSTMNDLLSKV